MMSVQQVSKLTGISARTLQYYDEIGLLKPSSYTLNGYRLYDEVALEKLQQILFFKELDFSLKEIDAFLRDPDFDKKYVFRKQKELLLLKREHIDGLVQLLSRLEKGESCMSFQEFHLTEYLNALEHFKNDYSKEVVKYWGSIENFNLFIQKIREDESHLAKLAIKQFGSIEEYTKQMKYNLAHFSEIMERTRSKEVKEIGAKSDAFYQKLTLDQTKDVSSDEILGIVHEFDTFLQDHNIKNSITADFWNSLILSYSNDFIQRLTDQKYGAGAAEYIVKAFQCYVKHKYV